MSFMSTALRKLVTVICVHRAILSTTCDYYCHISESEIMFACVKTALLNSFKSNVYPSCLASKELMTLSYD